MTTYTAARQRLPYRELLVLALCVFALCSSEYVLVGLLVNIAADLHASISQTGGLLTAYAMTAAIGGPIVSLLSAKVSLKRLIIGLMVLFALANVLIGLTNNFTLLLAARSIAALAHSTFAAACIVTAVQLAPRRSASHRHILGNSRV